MQSYAVLWSLRGGVWWGGRTPPRKFWRVWGGRRPPYHAHIYCMYIYIYDIMEVFARSCMCMASAGSNSPGFSSFLATWCPQARPWFPRLPGWKRWRQGLHKMGKSYGPSSFSWQPASGQCKNCPIPLMPHPPVYRHK